MDKQKIRILDTFYTKPEVANLCIKSVKHYIHFNKNDLIIEPSIGIGSFCNVTDLTHHYKFYDIDSIDCYIDKPFSYIQKDYLDINFDKFKKYNKIHVIGNPPFGRQSSLVKKFIKFSCQFCDTLSFILPKSFKKESMQKVFPLNFHLIHQFDLPKNSFMLSDSMENYNVPCVFQTWKKKHYEREQPVILTPKNFKFIKKCEIKENKKDKIISIRRVGFYAGNVDDNIKIIKNKSEQSHYFIQFDKEIDDIIDKIRNLHFENKDNVVGSRSISKQELIEKINKLIKFCK